GTRRSLAATARTDPAFDVALTNGGDRSVTQGASVSNPITATLVSGTTQSVSFTVLGLPAGVGASFAPATCSPTCTSTLTLSASASTSPNTYTLTVTGTATGGLSRSTSFRLTVTAPSSPTFDFALTNGGDRSVTQGASVSNPITATLVSGTAQ